ncbi:hypothetical protein OFN55_39010, partial [Escherichia coli]|nr:hypothetical protein [Escherichia coli]
LMQSKEEEQELKKKRLAYEKERDTQKAQTEVRVAEIQAKTALDIQERAERAQSAQMQAVTVLATTALEMFKLWLEKK